MSEQGYITARAYMSNAQIPLENVAVTILSQDGTLRCTPGSTLTPAEIISMDWLADNIIGSFPEPEELTEPARRLVSFQGIEQYRER